MYKLIKIYPLTMCKFVVPVYLNKAEKKKIIKTEHMTKLDQTDINDFKNDYK